MIRMKDQWFTDVAAWLAQENVIVFIIKLRKSNKRNPCYKWIKGSRQGVVFHFRFVLISCTLQKYTKGLKTKFISRKICNSVEKDKNYRHLRVLPSNLFGQLHAEIVWICFFKTQTEKQYQLKKYSQVNFITIVRFLAFLKTRSRNYQYHLVRQNLLIGSFLNE